MSREMSPGYDRSEPATRSASESYLRFRNQLNSWQFWLRPAHLRLGRDYLRTEICSMLTRQETHGSVADH
jgi:hypothetical protein